MTSDMAFECLLVSRDPGLVCVLNRLLQNLSITAQMCLNLSEAHDRMSRASIDLMLVDWEDDTADQLSGIQKSDRWYKPTVVAVSSLDFAVSDAHVVLHKPVTEDSGTIALRSAYSRMLCDYRRRTRYPLMSSVRATSGNNRYVDITITNIGDGGFGFVSKEDVAPGDTLGLRFLPPGAERPISIEARVCWTRSYGAAGCEYLHIHPTDLSILDDWLKSKTQIKKPFALV